MLPFTLLFCFLKIGLFTFGGGMSMIALIQDEVVGARGWLSAAEFADLLAVSEMTPGPIGINVATYTGYTAMANAGYGTLASAAGAVGCSAAVVALPFVLMMLALRLLAHYGRRPILQAVMRVLRLVALGLIASAAVRMVGHETFGTPGLNGRFVASVAVFLTVFALSLLPNTTTLYLGRHPVHVGTPSPIVLLALAGLFGLLFYA